MTERYPSRSHDQSAEHTTQHETRVEASKLFILRTQAKDKARELALVSRNFVGENIDKTSKKYLAAEKRADGLRLELNQIKAEMSNVATAEALEPMFAEIDRRSDWYGGDYGDQSGYVSKFDASSSPEPIYPQIEEQHLDQVADPVTQVPNSDSDLVNQHEFDYSDRHNNDAIQLDEDGWRITDVTKFPDSARDRYAVLTLSQHDENGSALHSKTIAEQDKVRAYMRNIRSDMSEEVAQTDTHSEPDVTIQQAAPNDEIIDAEFTNDHSHEKVIANIRKREAELERAQQVTEQDIEQAHDWHERYKAQDMEEAYKRNWQHTEFTNSRSEFAKAAAKAQGRILGKNRVIDRLFRNVKKYEDAKQEYDAKRSEWMNYNFSGNVAEQKTNIKQEAGVDVTDADIAKHHRFEEEIVLRNETTDNLKNSYVGRAVEWMNRGSRSQKIGKTVLVASAAGAVGFIAAPAAAATGVGAGIASGVALSQRYLRGYAKADNKRGMTTATDRYGEYAQNIDIELNDSDNTKEMFKKLDATFEAGFNEDTEYEQKKRRKAVVIGGMAVAMGSIAGYGLGNNFDAIKDWAGDKFSNVKDNFTSGTDTNASKPDMKPENDASQSPGNGTGQNGERGNGDGNGNGGNNNETDRDGGANKPDGNSDMQPREQPMPRNHLRLVQELDNYKVMPGDTIWDLAEQSLQENGVKHPTLFEIDSAKDAALAHLQATGQVGLNGELTAGKVLRAA